MNFKSIPIILTGVILALFVLFSGVSIGQQTHLDNVKQARNLDDDDVLAAIKTFMPRGGRDEYFAFAGTGNSGTMVVYGMPSMRIYKYVGVFTPEPWQGYGFDDESVLMLKKGSLDNRVYGYGDMRYPAFSETGGKYNGKYLFYSDGANSRIALLGLDDFETKQVLMHPLFISTHPGVAVTENTEYVIQTSQYPTTWDFRTADMEAEYDSKFKSGITFWKFEDPDHATESGHHIGRMIKDESFTLELPPLTMKYFDTGRKSSHGWVVGLADKDGKSYVYAVNYPKLEGLTKKTVNLTSVVTTSDAVAAGAVMLIEIPSGAKKVKTTPDGKYFIVANDEALVMDYAKLANAATGNAIGGIPVATYDQFLDGSVKLGNQVHDIAFDYRSGVAYASAFGDKKIIRWNYDSKDVESELALSFPPSELMTPQGLSAEPHSNYLIAVDKEGQYKNFVNIGPVRPNFQHLIDISGDNMKDIYTMSVPQANLYGSVSVLRTTIKPIIRYALGTNTRTGEISPFKTVAGQEKIDREGNRVHVFGTMIRSHITPEIVEVNEGDVVTFHLTNLERAEDETHGFTVGTYGIHGSFEPGKTASLTFTADRSGVFPYYCTEFCSALHLEMEGILMVKPKGFKGEKGEVELTLTPEQLVGYKKNYEDKLVVIQQTQDVINSVVTWLKENNYQDYSYVEALVNDAFDQLALAKTAEENHLKYAEEGKWKDAFLWAEQYWQYQVKTADVGLRAQTLLKEKLETKGAE
ncbi:MAG: hypothetical protein B6244_03645 [Candidatus Cloacimonetes bacterium 4572_55]|nr:MAG: hypothetical protein B6244_03645 [Candidatus Cloacimonetes bacterium 4572_55]